MQYAGYSFGLRRCQGFSANDANAFICFFLKKRAHQVGKTLALDRRWHPRPRYFLAFRRATHAGDSNAGARGIDGYPNLLLFPAVDGQPLRWMILCRRFVYSRRQTRNPNNGIVICGRTILQRESHGLKGVIEGNPLILSETVASQKQMHALRSAHNVKARTQAILGNHVREILLAGKVSAIGE